MASVKQRIETLKGWMLFIEAENIRKKRKTKK
jgi:hypothetical protein